MKNSIKIAIIVVVALIIGIAAVYFMRPVASVTHDVEKPVATTDFEKKIEHRVDTEIKDKEYADAHRAYADILQAIEMEASITLGDGKKKLSESEAKKCKQMVFYEFAPIFTQYGTGYLAGHNWAEATLGALRNEAQSLQAMGIAEGGTQTAQKLATIIKAVNDYHAAWQVARSASGCTTPSAISNLQAKINAYKHAPLTNCAELMQALNNAPTVARNSAASGVASYCRGVASRCTGYSNYNAWMSAYDEALGRISSFRSSFGTTTADLQAAAQALKSADQRALEYYTNRAVNGGSSRVSSGDHSASPSAGAARESADDSDEDW